MFKIALKISVLALIIAGAASLTSSPEAFAYNCSLAPSGFGFNKGEGDDNFAGVVVKAQVGQMTNGADDPDHKNWLVPVSYQLHSRLRTLPAGLHYDNSTPTSNVNARLFRLDANGDPVDRTDTRTFRTDETLYDTQGSWSGFPCVGWSAIGPGTATDEIGNRWGADCGQNVLKDGSNQWDHKELTRFWIDNIPNPYGQNGYWDIQIKDGAKYINGQMNPSSAYFEVGNGATKQITLTWHREPPKTYDGGGSSLGICKELSVSNFGSGNSNRRRVYVTASGMSVGKLRVFDKDGNLSQQDVYPSWPGDPTRPRSIAAWVGSGGSPPDGSKGIGPGENGQTKVWNYIPWDSTSIHIKVAVEDLWDDNGDGTKTWNAVSVSGLTRDETIDCYTGTCSVLSTWGDGPSGVVVAGGTIHVYATLSNTSRDNLQFWNPALIGPGSAVHGSDVVLDSGYTHPYYFDIPAPSSVQTYNFSVYPHYFGRVGPDCSGSTSVYQSFTLEPHAEASPNGTAENPGYIKYDTYVKNNGSVSVAAQTTSSFTTIPFSGAVTCANVGPVVTNGPYAPGGPNYTIGPASCTPSSVNAGDQYCSQIDFTGGYNSGYVGPGGPTDVVPTGMSGPSGDKQCVTIVNKPYFKAFNSSVSAGGAFSSAGNCSGGGVLGGWNDNTGGQSRGAGAQLSALALIKITGVASAQTSVPNSPVGAGLTFANSGTGVVTNTDRESPSLGGSYNDGGSYCLPNVEPKPGATIRPDGYVYPGNGSVSNSQSIFVNGDVYINSNVRYNLGNWSVNTDGSTNVPSFVLHATGNIYIAPGVTQLDGLYVSEKKIYTCATNNGGGNFVPVTAGNMYTTCNQQLIVNGAFVATQVNLLRTYGSLRNATAGERPTTANHGCSYSGGSTNKPVCAGEIFYLSPELYLSTPDIQLPANGAPRYDAITSLPPVL